MPRMFNLSAPPGLVMFLALMVMQMPAKEIVTAGPTPVGPYSHAVKAGGLIYVSGTLAQDAKGVMVGVGDVKAQTRQVLERMKMVLAASGSSLDQTLAVTVYLTSAADFQAMNEVYSTFWPKDPPTRTTVVSELVLPDAKIEMSMIAAPTGAERVVIHPSTWLRSPSPYSYAIRSGDTLFLSGLVSRNGRDNTVVAGDVATQTKTIMDSAGELLTAAGMTHAHIVSSRVYLTETSTFQAMNAAYRPYFPSGPPARATVQAALAGPQYSIEITFVASSAKKEVINTSPTPNQNLSTAIRVGKRVYLSGALGNTPENAGDATAQTRETLVRLRAALTAAGCTPADVVDAMVYLTDLRMFAAMNDAYRPFFGSDFPARATVKSGLVAAGGVVEIMLTAVTR